MARYYNIMLTGSGRDKGQCKLIYDDLRAYDIKIINSCGYGIDADCNKRVKHLRDGKKSDVEDVLSKIIEDNNYKIEYKVNSKGKCVCF